MVFLQEQEWFANDLRTFIHLGRMWDLIVSVPDHCLSFYFDQVSDATILQFKYFSRGISCQAHFSYVSVWDYVVAYTSIKIYEFGSRD